MSDEDVEEMNLMAEDGIEIDGIFRPSTNGFLGKGTVGFVYKGIPALFFFILFVNRKKISTDRNIIRRRITVNL